MKIFFLIALISNFLVAQDKVTSPHSNKLKIACESCHTTSDWKNVPRYKFNHDKVGYPLNGEHKFAECSSCHKSLVFSQVGIACADCHTDIHKGELGIQCETCHSSQNWENRRQVFDQHNQTNFPLVGVHANLDCESCHINEQQRQFANLSVDCQGCHLTDYMTTLTPSHEKAGFDLNCQKCHLLNAPVWTTAIFEHPSSFPLKSGHSGLDCADCHTGDFGGTSTDCYACHRKDYEASSDPNHLTFYGVLISLNWLFLQVVELSVDREVSTSVMSHSEAISDDEFTTDDNRRRHSNTSFGRKYSVTILSVSIGDAFKYIPGIFSG